MKILIILLLLPHLALGNLTLIENYNSTEDERINLLVDFMIFNLKNNGWNTVLTYGHLPDSLYNKIKGLPFTFVTSNADEQDFELTDAVPYHLNTIIFECFNLTDFSKSLYEIMGLPFWHPHTNIFLLYNKQESNVEIARIFFSLWFYKASNVILVQYDDLQKLMYITQYDPFVVRDSRNVYGCRTTRAVGMPITQFNESFMCEEKCRDLGVSSKNRRFHLGTCIGLQNHVIPYDDRKQLTELILFKERGENLNGFEFGAYFSEIRPFFIVTVQENGIIEISSRDGTIWNTLAQLMNFTMDFTPSREVMKRFNFEVNIQQLFAAAHRKGDLFIIPIYQFDIAILEVDYSFAYKDSGVCFVSHKAGFETVLFDLKTLIDNFNIFMEFSASVCCIWFVFILYSVMEVDVINVDLIGKNFMNTIRSALSLTLYNPPKRESFRIFLTIILWSFFVLNFSTQAAIISFFTAFKRGKEVETYADIVEKGYRIQGLASPDVLMPEDNELYRKINSKLEPIYLLTDCIEPIANDTHRFCLVDCAVARYIEFNLLNSKGEQYLHIARDRIHSYYLCFMFAKHSVLTNIVDMYLMRFLEAGLIQKWEQFRFSYIKEDPPVKPLAMEDFQGIFNVYFGVVLITCFIFIIELLVGNYKRVQLHLSSKLKKWKRIRNARKIIRLERKQNKITNVCSSTQT